MISRLALATLIILASSVAIAGDITLNADEGVEYHQLEQKMVARGNAVATKDDLSIKAQTLVGYYNPKIKNNQKRKLWKKQHNKKMLCKLMMSHGFWDMVYC